MKQKYNYAFDFAAEIVSELPFNKIPVNELANAIRDRLARIEADPNQNHEAFNCFDTYEDEGLV